MKVTGWHFTAKIAKELADANCKAIICFAGLQEVDAKLRGEGAFEDSVNAVTLCREFGIPFAISVINTKYVANQVTDLVKLAMTLGARSFHLASLIPQPIDVENQFKILGPLEPTHSKEKTNSTKSTNSTKKLETKSSSYPTKCSTTAS